MPLAFGRSGKQFRVIRINGSDETRMRLVNMGITNGSKIRIISRMPAAFLVGVRETRIMLDIKLAEQIDVQ
jgi:Fe2+ transport system protein FeoA